MSVRHWLSNIAVSCLLQKLQMIESCGLFVVLLMLFFDVDLTVQQKENKIYWNICQAAVISADKKPTSNYWDGNCLMTLTAGSSVLFMCTINFERGVIAIFSSVLYVHH